MYPSYSITLAVSIPCWGARGLNPPRDTHVIDRAREEEGDFELFPKPTQLCRIMLNLPRASERPPFPRITTAAHTRHEVSKEAVICPIVTGDEAQREMEETQRALQFSKGFPRATDPTALLIPEQIGR